MHVDTVPHNAHCVWVEYAVGEEVELVFSVADNDGVASAKHTEEKHRTKVGMGGGGRQWQ